MSISVYYHRGYQNILQTLQIFNFILIEFWQLWFKILFQVTSHITDRISDAPEALTGGNPMG